jgi:hypothetical protein
VHKRFGWKTSRRLLGTHKSRWEYNIKIVEEYGCECEKWLMIESNSGPL